MARESSRVDRFWSKVDRRSAHGCWLWNGSTTSRGYGQFKADRVVQAHRYAYELLVGPIPEGLELDHLCRVRNCVNPAHLEPVTHRENLLRGTSPVAVNARRESCIHGHELTESNVYVAPRGGRACRTCRSIRKSQAKAVSSCG